MMRGTGSRLLALVVCAIGFAAIAHGQDQEWIGPEAVPGRADALLSELEAAKPSDAVSDEVAEIERGLGETGARLDALAARIDSGLAGPIELGQIEDLRREVTAGATPLTKWHAALEAESQRVSDALAGIRSAEAVWSATLVRSETAETDEAVGRRVRTSLQLLSEAGSSLRAWRDRLLALDDRVLDCRTAATATLARLEQAAKAQRTGLLVPDRAPLWQTGYAAALREELPRVPETVARFIAQNVEYVGRDPRPLVAELLLAALFAIALQRIVPRAQQRAALTPELARATRVLERPIAIAVLLALLPMPWLQPLAPRRFVQMMALVALIAVARLVSHGSSQMSRVVLASLFALLFLDRLGLAVEELPTLSQAIFLVEMALGVAIAIRVLRRGGIPGNPGWVRGSARVVALALALALAAALGGWGGLAGIVGRTALVATLSAVYVWAAVAALEALLVWLVQSPRWNRLLRGGRRSRRIVRWSAVVSWLYLTVVTTGRREVVAHALRIVLDAGVSVGALSITVGGVLAFAVTIAAAPIVARVINVVLEENVYPRTRLSRGMPYALSTMIRYAVYSLAFVAALAAAGVQLSQLSILLGGLGVGVGLGLQDFVKNFAAGLTLLLERRVHVGDVVQIPSREVHGRVLEIAMRAVVVRNWDGAEVVVPNIDLISGAVTNWTLSDQLRRIELPVGVAYGTDPERVVGVLLEVAKAHEDIIDHPAPQALFLGFGQSSLDFVLRAWTDRDYDRTSAIRSELVLATHRSLRDAGIEIPFPQRGLHLASVAPAVREAFGAKADE
jgi:small-conductance mechanosensitive channel